MTRVWFLSWFCRIEHVGMRSCNEQCWWFFSWWKQRTWWKYLIWMEKSRFFLSWSITRKYPEQRINLSHLDSGAYGRKVAIFVPPSQFIRSQHSPYLVILLNTDQSYSFPKAWLLHGVISKCSIEVLLAFWHLMWFQRQKFIKWCGFGSFRSHLPEPYTNLKAKLM